MQAIADGPWTLGLNSVDLELPQGQYQWLFNGINKGGLIATRPGQRAIEPGAPTSFPQYLKIFTPKEGLPRIVFASSGTIFAADYPYNSLSTYQVGGTDFTFSNSSPIQLEIAVIGVTEAEDGTITEIDPFPVLMVCDGTGRSGFWDGTNARLLDPDPDGAHETPVCSRMKWIGNRLWVMQGRKIRASNLLNPIKFTEENTLIEGGYFNLPANGTGFGVTPDFRSLLAFTDYTTTSFQAGILNRASWASTADFQKVIFSNIGCAAPKSVVNQYGMTWWYSHDGLINLDSALQTYRSSEIKTTDAQMRRSRANFSDDISGICATSYDNYLLISVPSGDIENYHTWVMDGNPLESVSSPSMWSSAWTGTRPVCYDVGIINGKKRCFCLSADLPTVGSSDITTSVANVWELFLQDRRDIGYNISHVAIAKNVPVYFETRMIPLNVLAEIEYLELDIEELIGTVQLDIYYRTRRGAYKKFGTKQIVSTVGSVNAEDTLPSTFAQYLPQKRTIKTVNESLLTADFNPTVETSQTRNIDKSYSFLIIWTGQMALSKIRAFFKEYPEQFDGAKEENETTDRYIRPTGEGAVLSTGPTAIPITVQNSSFLPTVTPRWSEVIYQSLS